MRTPGWVLPVILTLIFGLVTAVALNQRINWRQFMTQQIERNPRSAQMTPEQKEQQIEAGAKYAPYTSYIFGVLAPVVVVLIVASGDAWSI